MTARFDPTALTAPVDRQEVRAFRRSRKTAGSTSAASVAIAVVVAIIGALVLIPTFVGTLISVPAAFGTGGLSLIALMPLLALVAVVGLGVFFGIRAFLGAGVRAYRLSRFARANGMAYVGSINNPSLPGMIFSHGSSRAANDAVRGEQPRFVEFANYRYTTGSGKNRTTHRWGYVAIKLDVPLPHIVLDALGNNGLFGASNLPMAFRTEQRLSLEGDFDRYFSLYCPEGYERDALYLFTPDVMARFIDNAAALDVEIVDDWLFLYTKRDVSTLDPATWAWLFGTVGAILDKLAQWSRWRDDRLVEESAGAAPAPTTGAPIANPADPVPFAPPAGMLRPPPGVASSGRRLRGRVPWAAFIVLGAIVLIWVVSQMGILGALFLH